MSLVMTPPTVSIPIERGATSSRQILGFLTTLTREDTTLHSSTECDSLVRVDPLVGLLAVEEVLDELLHLRNTSGASDEDDLIELILLEGGVLHHLVHRA